MSKKLIQEKILKEKKLSKIAQNEAMLYEMLNTEESGFIETTGKEKTLDLTQDTIKKNVSQKVSEMCFSLSMDNGPVYCKYTRDGRFLNIRNNDGYFSSLDTNKMNVFFEENVDDVVYDMTYLHNEDFIALAQKNNVFIYNKQGTEVHAVRENKNVKKLEYLPYHFLLVSSSSDGFLRYQDTTNGKFVGTVFIKDKCITDLKQNKSTAVVYTGHKNGVVSLWSPNSKNYLSKILCYKSSISNIEIDRAGTYLYTTGIDCTIKVWDIRKTYKPVNFCNTRYSFSSTSLSQKSILAASYGDKIQMYKNLSTANNKDVLYLKHREIGKNISSLSFKNYEDILTIGHTKGVSNIIVPGSGDPIYDTLEDSPFISTRQKQDREVKMLLDKIPYTLISKNPFLIEDKPKEEKLKSTRKHYEEDDKLRNILSKYLKK